MKSTKITDLNRDVLVCIIEWLGTDDALRLCRSLRVSSSLAYQYAAPPPPHAILDALIDYDLNDRKSYYYNLVDCERHKDNFNFIFKNKKLEAQNSLSDRFRLALILNCVNQVREFLADERIADLNSHFVYGNSNKEIVKLLLADPRCDPSHGHFVMNAIHRGRTSALECLLLDKRVDPSKENNQAFRNAIDMGYLCMAQMLLRHPKVDPTDAQNSALISAAERGYIDILKVLLEDTRIDPSAQGNEAIIVASANGHLEIVNLLLADSRVNPACRRNRALNRAIKNGNHDVVQRLLADPRVRKKGNKPSILMI
jgi:hypothetical protein